MPVLRQCRSATELRSQTGAKEPSLQRSVSATALPPIELRGIRALPPAASSTSGSLVESQAPSKESGRGMRATAAHAAAAAVLSPASRSFRASSHSDEDSVDDVSQFTASECGSVRGIGYQKSDSSKNSARDSGLKIGGQRPHRKKRGRQSDPSQCDVCCPRGHEIVYSERHKPWFCHGCGRVSSACHMECFRCNRCNYNLCDQCFQAQVEDASPPPLWPRPSSEASVAASLPQSVDELLMRSKDDRTLPGIPPGFSRGLSPGREFSPRGGFSANSTGSGYFRPAASAASTGASWMSTSGKLPNKTSKSPSPTRLFDDASPSQTYLSSRRSSASSLGNSMASSMPPVDPMLRIVSLSEWIAKSGIFGETLAEYALAHNNGGDTRAAVQGLADVMVKGMSYGQPGAPKARLDRAALEELSQYSRSKYRSLPLEDVHEDLKIWHLTLMRRPVRKRMEMVYGRVTKRPDDDSDIDPAHLFQMGGKDGSRDFPDGRSGHGEGQSPGIEFGHDGYGRPGSGYDSSSSPDGKKRIGGGQSEFDGGNLGPGGKPRGDSRPGEDGSDVELDSNGEPVDRGGPSRGTDGGDKWSTGDFADGGKPGSSQSDLRPDSVGDNTGPGGTSGKSGRERTGSDAKGKESKSGKLARQKSEKANGLEGEEDTPDVREETEEEKLLAAGCLFRVKQIAEQVILDEFANMLLPPPSLSAVTQGGDSRPSTDEGRGHRRLKSQQSMAFSAGIQSTLADDFRKCIEDAFRLIEFPEEVKKKKADTADVEAFLREDDAQDPAMEGLLPKSAAMSLINFRSDASKLETHLRMRAERHGRRLQSRSQKGFHGHGHEDLWPRRLRSCRQSLNYTNALDAFAETRAREKLATA